MMMWHTMVGLGMCTRIMTTCDVLLGQKVLCFFKFAMHIRPRFPLEPRQ